MSASRVLAVQLQPHSAFRQASSIIGFAEFGHYASFHCGQVVASSRDPDPCYGVVVTGVVKSCLVTQSNREYITGLHFEGQLVQPPTQVGHRHGFVDAASDASLYCFSREALAKMLAEQDWARRAIPEMMAAEINCSRNWTSLLGRRTVEEKLAGFFGLIASHATCRVDSTDLSVFEIPLKRGQMAEFLGVTSESVSRGVTALRRAGVIRLHDMRHFEILKPERLAELAGE